MSKNHITLILSFLALSLLTGFSFGGGSLNIKKVACENLCEKAKEKCIEKVEKRNVDQKEKETAAELVCGEAYDECKEKCD